MLRRSLSALCGLLLAAGLAAIPSPALAGPAAFVDLGRAATYSVLAGAGVSNTGTATVLALDLGLSPTGAIAGFPPGTTMGTIHDKDAAAEAAQEDRQEAYDAAAGQLGGTPFAGDQAGATFKPGVHTSSAAFTNTGTVTLDADGDASAVFVFQIGAAFSSAAASKVVLTDGALANNVYWQVLGAVSLGANAKLVGTFLAAGVVSFGEGASLKGRVLTPSTVALASSPVTQPIDDLTAPVVTVDGGAARSTNDATPLLSGTTDEPLGRPVSVTVSGQTLATTVAAGGRWSVAAATLAEGAHPVGVTVTDASRNSTTETQTLTVDLTAPTVTVDGGAALATNDTTATITGTTDLPGGTPVTVTVGVQTLTTPADAGGGWAVTTAALSESAHRVAVSARDAAGNSGSSGAVLTVDLTAPVLAIDGGAERSTVDTSPWTYGTTGEQAGTVVRVSVGGQSLTATVASGGAWGVSATTLPPGVHRVVASITDAAGNTTSAGQTLTIGSGPGPPGPPPPVPPAPGPPAPVPPVPTAPAPPIPRYQPDATIRRGTAPATGAGRFGTSARQRLTVTLRRTAPRALFTVRLVSVGTVADRLVLRGTPSSTGFSVAYLVRGKNVTRSIRAGTFRTPALRPGASVTVVVRIALTRRTRPGDRRAFQVRATSAHAPTKHDTVAAVVRR